MKKFKVQLIQIVQGNYNLVKQEEIIECDYVEPDGEALAFQMDSGELIASYPARNTIVHLMKD